MEKFERLYAAPFHVLFVVVSKFLTICAKRQELSQAKQRLTAPLLLSLPSVWVPVTLHLVCLQETTYIKI
jgi:hypothetical protein